MPHLPEEIILLLVPFAPLFSNRVWLHAQLLLLGAILAPGKRTVTAALRVMGLARERRFTNYHRVLNRATWLARHASRHHRTPQRAEDQGQGLLPGCGALHEEACHPLFRPEVGFDDAVGPCPLGAAGVGLAVFDGAVLAC